MTPDVAASAPSTPAPVAPSLPGTLIGGSLAAFRRNPLAFLSEAAATHGDVVRFRFGPTTVHALRHPDDVRHLLVGNHHNYDKQTRGYDSLRAFLGNGLLTSEGDFWLRQRRIAQPAFHRKRIAGFATTMTDMTLDMLDRWADHARDDQPIDVAAEMTHLTLRIAGKTLLHADVEHDAHEVGDAVLFLNHHANESMVSLFNLPQLFPTSRNIGFRRIARTLDGIVLGIIEARRRGGDDPGDLLSMLMEARDEETGEQMTDGQLRDEVMTMFLAGHETTANALSWTFYLLSLHPEVGRTLDAELAEVLGGRVPRVEDLGALEYTLRVIKESMRLYPPAWLLSRRALEDDVIGGYRIPRHSMVFASPYTTHRHPDLWDDPETFEPDHFLPEAEAGRSRFAYMPFGGGPRQCIGNTFALMEAQLVLATVWQRYRPKLVPGHRVVPEPLITLRPKYGLHMQLGD